MKGIDLAKKYYEEVGASVFHENFPELEGKLAFGIAGSGSECFGFDDEISKDHDFEPGFCIWIPGEDVIDSKQEFQLERAYAKLPKEFEGYKKPLLNPVGGSRHGVIRISDFLESKLGRKDDALTISDWFTIPEYSLAEVVNGEIFRDDSGVFTQIREGLRYMPEDVRLKKLAGSLVLMGQSGRYNYPRCIAHNESGAAQLAVAEFVKHTMHAAFLINMEYMPYYKWSFRAMRNLGLLSEEADKLERLLTTSNTKELVEEKRDIIDEISNNVIDALKMLELTKQTCDDLGRHADSVNNIIQDNNLRNMDILVAV